MRVPTPWTTAVFPIAALALAAACASGSGGRAAPRRDACQLRPADSVFAAVGMVYRDCAVDRRVRLVEQGTRPDFTPAQPRTACFSADLEFVVDANGRPEMATARIARTNDQAFARSVLATLPTRRYEPALREGAPVRQIVTDHYSVSTMVVRVPAGSSPGTASRGQRAPSC